jgi:hypothetical protein
MNFQIGDLIITKDNRNRRVPAYIVGIHKSGEDRNEIHYWTSPSITIQYSQDHWMRLPISAVERHLSQPFKPARWYHYPVKK